MRGRTERFECEFSDFDQTRFNGIVGIGEPVRDRGVQHADGHLGEERGVVVCAHLAAALAFFDERDKGVNQTLEVGMGSVWSSVAAQELEQNISGHAPTRRDSLGGGADEVAQFLGTRAVSFEMLRRQSVEVFEDFPRHQAEERLFILEMVEERRRGDICEVCDFVDSGRLKALFREEVSGNRKDSLSNLALTPFPAAEGAIGLDSAARSVRFEGLGADFGGQR